jgi:hypothetical protein
MATWREIEQDAPEFADRVRALFQSGTNKTIATLRRDSIDSPTLEPPKNPSDWVGEAKLPAR